MSRFHHLLVVSSDQEFRNSVALFFCLRALVVSTAQDGGEALDQLNETRPNVDLVDLHLTDMTGFRLMCELHARRPTLPLIIVSDHISPDLADDALRLGAWKFIEKPFDPSPPCSTRCGAAPRAQR